MTKNEIENLRGNFSWNFGDELFIETDKGNFVWSDPEYEGDNTLYLFNGSYEDYLKQENISFCRDKGTHLIKNYCGDFVWCE